MVDCCDGGMTGMLLEGKGMMFLLGLVYSVMSDCVSVETRLSKVIFLCCFFFFPALELEEAAEEELDADTDLVLREDEPDGPGKFSGKSRFGFGGDSTFLFLKGEVVEAEMGANLPIAGGGFALDLGKRTMLEDFPTLRFPACREEAVDDNEEVVVD